MAQKSQPRTQKSKKPASKRTAPAAQADNLLESLPNLLAHPGLPSPQNVLHLQRLVGNQAVQRLLAQKATANPQNNSVQPSIQAKHVAASTEEANAQALAPTLAKTTQAPRFVQRKFWELQGNNYIWQPGNPTPAFQPLGYSYSHLNNSLLDPFGLVKSFFSYPVYMRRPMGAGGGAAPMPMPMPALGPAAPAFAAGPVPDATATASAAAAAGSAGGSSVFPVPMPMPDATATASATAAAGNAGGSSVFPVPMPMPDATATASAAAAAGGPGGSSFPAFPVPMPAPDATAAVSAAAAAAAGGSGGATPPMSTAPMVASTSAAAAAAAAAAPNANDPMAEWQREQERLAKKYIPNIPYGYLGAAAGPGAGPAAAGTAAGAALANRYNLEEVLSGSAIGDFRKELVKAYLPAGAAKNHNKHGSSADSQYHVRSQLADFLESIGDAATRAAVAKNINADFGTDLS